MIDRAGAGQDPAGDAGEGSTARTLGERAGEEAQGLLPVLGDALEGFWDGLRLVAPDGSSEVYRGAYEAGAFVPEALAAIWDFLVGFFSALFG